MKAALALIIAATSLPLAACHHDHHDDAVGHSKTTTKSTVQTPEGRRTVTETKTKDTTVVPK